jgi:pantoate--beta-alanine ligase
MLRRRGEDGRFPGTRGELRVMHVWNSLAGWKERRRALEGRSIGLVPTMGALHEGHASLVDRCRRENQIAVVSLFVNPTQFNDPKDLERYPRTLESDLALLESLGTDDVLAPRASDLYPRGYCFRVTSAGTADLMEGRCRPGFFEGVLTVVLKLLNLVRPERAYFGEKDFQQLRVVTEMVEDLFLSTSIVGCPIVREPSGLAQSSRNRLLTADGRTKAASLYRVLSTATGPADARLQLEAGGFAVDYVEEHWGRRFAAAFLENVRLIDNVPLP